MSLPNQFHVVLQMVLLLQVPHAILSCPLSFSSQLSNIILSSSTTSSQLDVNAAPYDTWLAEVVFAYFPNRYLVLHVAAQCHDEFKLHMVHIYQAPYAAVHNG